MRTKKIKGKVTFVNLETGFWGIIGGRGKKWLPENLPEQLKYEGKKIEVDAVILPDDAGIFMWGTPIRIISFGTLMP